MKTKSIVAELTAAREKKCAVGAFNIFNYLSARAVIVAAQKRETPVILQTSTQTVRKFGPLELGAMLRQLKWNASVNAILHLDHCQDVDMAKACIDAGWDSIMFDGSRLPLEENIARSREVVQYAHAREIQVEGELGRIAGVEDDLAEAHGLTASYEESLTYVRESGVDLFAPAIGTAHGVYKGIPRIDFELVASLKKALDTPIVIHGGTGLSEDTFRRLIHCGGTKINVSTAIKQAYLGGGKTYLLENPGRLDPIGFDQFLHDQIEEVVLKHLDVFGG